MSQATVNQFKALGQALRRLDIPGEIAYAFVNNTGSLLLGIPFEGDGEMTEEQRVKGQVLNDIARAAYYDEASPEVSVELPLFTNAAVVNALAYDIGRQGFDHTSAAFVTAMTAPLLLGLEPLGKAVDGPDRDNIRGLVQAGVEGYKRGANEYLGLRAGQRLSAGGSA